MRLFTGPLAPRPEFALIHKLLGPKAFDKKARKAGDDAVLLGSGAHRWVITTDSSVEGVHFRFDWCTPQEALYKSLLSNLSDINAMGGKARYLLFNLGIGAGWTHKTINQIGKSLQDLQKTYGLQCLGGDTVTTQGPGFFSFTVLGQIKGKPLLRSAARPGYRLVLSGASGLAQGGLWLLQGQKTHQGQAAKMQTSPLPPKKTSPSQKKARAKLIQLFRVPQPPLNLGPLIARHPEIVAAIDISDGLSSECWHLSRASGVKVVIEVQKLFLAPELISEFGPTQALTAALHGGEDYQLLLALPQKCRLYPKLLKMGCQDIGYLKKGQGVYLLEQGKIKQMLAQGYSHTTFPKNQLV